MQAYDYFHSPGNDGISPLLPLALAPLGKDFRTPNPTQRLAFQPFFVGDEALPLAQLAIYLTCTGYVSGGRWRIGIYDTSPPADQDIYPKALVKDFGLTAAPTSAGLQFITTTAGAGVSLVNGLYYYAAVWEGVAAATYSCLHNLCPPNGSNGTGPWLLNDLGGPNASPMGWYVDAINPANALPANAPAGMTFSVGSSSPEPWNPCVFPVF